MAPHYSDASISGQSFLEPFDALYRDLSKIRKESIWGRKQSLIDVIRCLSSEVDELEAAIQVGDRYNQAEELGDIIMMALFCFVVVEEKSAIDLSRLLYAAEKKLRSRYPDLLGGEAKQLPLPLLDDAESLSAIEEHLWVEGKRNSRLLEFSFCINQGCDAFQIPNHPSLQIVPSRNKIRVLCALCGTSTPVAQSILFPGFRRDRNLLSAAVAHFVRTMDQSAACGRFCLRPKDLARAVRSCRPVAYALARLLSERFGLDEKRCLEIIEDYR